MRVIPTAPLLLVLGSIGLSAIWGIAAAQEQPRRPRARQLGSTRRFPPGPLNAITDVEGVRVGHVTIVEGDRVRTGVTAILPHGGNLFQDKVAGASSSETPSASSLDPPRWKSWARLRRQSS